MSATPRLSVIVPAHKAADQLPESLGRLSESDLPRSEWELIVVNDGADSETADAASRFADILLKLPGKPRGPAYARNRGSEVARGDILVFVDADVCVHPDTLRRFVELFDARPDVVSVFGSYDDTPPAPGMVSKYRNLLHHWVHHQDAGEAETFWAGCGAIRTVAFHEVGRYDEWHFNTPQIEDIELGRRLRRRGHIILLEPSIQVCHLKRWTFFGVLLTDLKNRGVPWTRLILHEGPSGGSRRLNVRPLHRWCVILAFLAVMAVLSVPFVRNAWPLVISVTAVAIITLLHRSFFDLLWRRAGWSVAVGSIPLLYLFYLMSGVSAVYGSLAYALVGAPQPPPDVAAFEEVGVDTWPPVPMRPKESVWYEHDR